MAKWVKVDVRNDASLFPIFLFESGAGPNSAMQDALGTSFRGLLYSFRSNRWAFYEVKGDWERVAKELGKKVEEDPDFVSRSIHETYRLGKEMLALTREIASTDLSKKSNAELSAYYNEYCKRCKSFRGFAWIAPGLDLSGSLTEKLGGILQGRLKKMGKEAEETDYFMVLTNPKKRTNLRQQDVELLEIASQVRNTAGIKEPKIQKLLDEHTQKYEWLPCNYENKPWTKSYFESVIESLLKQKTSPAKQLEEIQEKEKENEEKKIAALKELKLASEQKHLFDIASDLIFFKADRKDILFESYFEMRGLLLEIAKRLQLTERQVRFMLPGEVREALSKGKTDPSLYSERYKFSVAISENNSTNIYVGVEAKRILEEEVEKEEVKQVDELKGQCASPGYAKGIVRIIHSPEDMGKMQQGDILVAPATNPDVVPAMKKAAAIVTNTGGLTAHAAIVSRELNIPCVVGTKTATDVLKDGEMIEVDATNGIVRKLKM